MRIALHHVNTNNRDVTETEVTARFSRNTKSVVTCTVVSIGARVLNSAIVSFLWVRYVLLMYSTWVVPIGKTIVCQIHLKKKVVNRFLTKNKNKSIKIKSCWHLFPFFTVPKSQSTLISLTAISHNEPLTSS